MCNTEALESGYGSSASVILWRLSIGDSYLLYLLSFYLVHGECLVSDGGKIYILQVDATDGTGVHGAVVDDAVAHVGSGSPLRGAGNFRGNLPQRKLDAYRDVEVVQYLETLEHGVLCCGLSGGCGLVERGTDKA